MLHVDLTRLEREGRARIDADIPTDSPFWQDMDVEPRAPLQVRLDAQQAGPDVVVRGDVSGSFGLSCRRCLEPVTAGIDEQIGLLYKAGGVEADDAEDVLPLPERGNELDVSAPVREQVFLAVPRYVICREDCEGLCPQCGTNLNTGTCDCTSEEEDERWAPLRQLRRDV